MDNPRAAPHHGKQSITTPGGQSLRRTLPFTDEIHGGAYFICGGHSDTPKNYFYTCPTVQEAIESICDDDTDIPAIDVSQTELGQAVLAEKAVLACYLN